MPDVYAMITDVDEAVVGQVAEAMEVSAADPQQQAMVRAYLGDLGLGADAGVLEVGCGTGSISRMIAAWPGVGDVVGVDPSPILVDRARALSPGIGRLTFEVGDGRALSFAPEMFDAVVVHRVLSHVPEPAQVLAEAQRVLRPGGRIAVFDGDYATITLARAGVDPLQACVDAFRPAYITDAWVVRRLPELVRAAGFAEPRLRSFGFVQTDDPDYMLTIADRGADVLAADGTIGSDLAAALKAEARRRVAEHAFFGHVAYTSIVARKSG